MIKLNYRLTPPDHYSSCRDLVERWDAFIHAHNIQLELFSTQETGANIKLRTLY